MEKNKNYMKNEIFIVSGFLGSGKTTFIKEMIKYPLNNEKIILIENDFGDVSVDAILLKSGEIEVRELNSGCICCSLSDNFVDTIKELIKTYPDRKILIEPSGVGKLSDIENAINDSKESLHIKSKITLVDVKRCEKYLENFGEFFEDQIKHADVVVLSHVYGNEDKILAARKIIKDLNENAIIEEEISENFKWDEILNYKLKSENIIKHECGCHNHHHDGDCCFHHENHVADDVFDTVTIEVNRNYSKEEITKIFTAVEQGDYGDIIRAKGIIPATKKYFNIQYNKGDFQISDIISEGNIISFIGQKIDNEALAEVFKEIVL